jgi:hypothetical protein
MKQEQTITEKVLKLPVWAQEHIQLINKLRLQAEDKLKCFLDGQSPTNVYVWESGSEEERFRYIQSDQVVFELENGNQIQVRNEGDSVRIMGIGFGELTIKPHVSNVVGIRHGDNSNL